MFEKCFENIKEKYDCLRELFSDISTVDLDEDVVDNEKVLMLMPWETCNLKCKYCYETYKSNDVMDIELAKSLINNAFSDLGNEEILKIEIRGGEPLVRFDWIKQVCEWIWYNYKQNNYYIYFVTNGTLLNTNIREWIKTNREKLKVVLSLDGYKNTHNHNRFNSFDMIDLDFFLETWNVVPVICTLTPECLDNLYEDCMFFLKNRFRVTVNIVLGYKWSTTDIEKCASELIKVADDLAMKEYPGYINLFGKLSMHYQKSDNDKRKKIKCKAANNRELYTPDGNKYPCQLFIPDAFNRNVLKGVDYIRMMKECDANPVECSDCFLFFQCQCCPGYAMNSHGTMTYRTQMECDITLMRVLVNAYYWIKKAINKNYLDIDKQVIVKSIEIFDDYCKQELIYGLLRNTI